MIQYRRWEPGTGKLGSWKLEAWKPGGEIDATSQDQGETGRSKAP